MKSTQKQEAVVSGYSDLFLQCNHIKKCAQKMLKNYSKACSYCWMLCFYSACSVEILDNLLRLTVKYKLICYGHIVACCPSAFTSILFYNLSFLSMLLKYRREKTVTALCVCVKVTHALSSLANDCVIS